MRRTYRFVVFAVPLALTAITVGAGARQQPHAGNAPRESFHARETRRLQAHFDSVLRELRTSVPTRLNQYTSGRTRAIDRYPAMVSRSRAVSSQL